MRRLVSRVPPAWVTIPAAAANDGWLRREACGLALVRQQRCPFRSASSPAHASRRNPARSRVPRRRSVINLRDLPILRSCVQFWTECDSNFCYPAWAHMAASPQPQPPRVIHAEFPHAMPRRPALACQDPLGVRVFVSALRELWHPERRPAIAIVRQVHDRLGHHGRSEFVDGATVSG